MDRIKRLSSEVLVDNKAKFGEDFADNKKALDQISIVRSKGLKNEIAGYITKFIKKEIREEKAKQARIAASKSEQQSEIELTNDVITEEATETVVKATTEEATETVVKATTEEAAETVVKATTEEATETVVKATTEEAAETVVKATTEEAAETVVKATTEEAAETVVEKTE